MLTVLTIEKRVLTLIIHCLGGQESGPLSFQRFDLLDVALITNLEGPNLPLMASLPSVYHDVGRKFIRLDRHPDPSAIKAVLLGGSSIYSLGDAREERGGRDWDGAIIVSTKQAIFHLVNEQRRSLMEMLSIVREECPGLRVPDPLSPRWDQFDAVRFAGFDRLENKRSVKIMSLEYFTKPKTSLHILSFKDKRIFKTFRLPDTSFYLLQQASRLEDELVILHDQWIYAAPPKVCVHGDEASFAAFGVTADLLVSGVWILGNEPYGRLIQSQILACYSLIAKQHANTQSFARSCHFSTKFTGWFTKELLNLLSDTPLKRLRCHCSFPGQRFLCGETFMALDRSFLGTFTPSLCLPSRAVELYGQTEALVRFERPSSVFSSNSTTAEITLPADSVGGKVTKIFCKRSQHAQQELEGAMNAATFGLRVQLPHLTSSGELLYPFFEGMTESELRLSFLQSGRNNWYAAETLLYAELVKAEDMLRVYKECLDSNFRRREMAGQPIHRLFHFRLVEHARFRQFYGDSSNIGGKALSMVEFLEMPWKVNGVAYPSLGELFCTATEVVHPESRQCMSCPTVFGLGDAHGGNIMISSGVSANGGHEILYVDYETAGFHPVMLDLAKPFYNDVFFNTLYMDVLPDTPETMCELDGGFINVQFTPYVDEITQAIFDIKRRYLVQPLFDLVLSHGGDLEKNVPLLSAALLLCATLTRNYSKSPDGFFRNIATGLVLSQADNTKGLYLCLRKLGIEC